MSRPPTSVKILYVDDIMDQAHGTFCKLCVQEITGNNSQVVGEVTLKALAFLSLNVRSDKRDNYICNNCSVKLSAAYDFNTMCLDTEGSLLPYTGKARQIDLKDIKVEKSAQANIISDRQVCRLCMNIVEDGFMSLEELCDVNMVDKYIPEVNFGITKDPVLCKKCRNSLVTHIHCLKKWMDVEKMIKMEAQNPNDYACIKSEEIDVKVEELNEDGDTSLHQPNEHSLKCDIVDEACAIKQEIEDWESINTYAIGTSDDYETNCKSNLLVSEKKSTLRKPPTTNNNTSGIQKYECKRCNYVAKKKFCMKEHQVIHKSPSELRMYECNKCSFQTKWKRCLEKHKITHKDPSETEMYKCDKCDYETKHKNCVKQHQVKHKSFSESQIYKCSEDGCGFRSKWKRNIQRHKKRHMDPSEMEMYKCDKCYYDDKGKRECCSRCMSMSAKSVTFTARGKEILQMWLMRGDN